MIELRWLEYDTGRTCRDTPKADENGVMPAVYMTSRSPINANKLQYRTMTFQDMNYYGDKAVLPEWSEWQDVPTYGINSIVGC